MLDQLVQMRVASAGVAAPPAEPGEGLAVIVGTAGTGAFAGHEGSVAAFQDGGWRFFAPRPGLIAYVETDRSFLFCDGAAWKPLLDGPFPMLGVNATPDATSRLAVGADAALFTHAGHDHRLVVNKAAAGDTASVVFQTGYSGRAEFGLTGDDDFHLKVSADGATFREAMAFDRTSGRVLFPQGISGARERLSADRTYHVDPAGSDDADGLSTASAFATVQRAVDAALDLDCAGHSVTIRLAAGTHQGPVSLTRPLLGTDRLTILGDAITPGNVLLSHNSHIVTAAQGAWVVLQGVALTTEDWGSGLYATGGGTIHVGAVEFRDVVRMHMEIAGSGKITVIGNYTITGGAIRHYYANGSGAYLESTNITTTLTGTPAFSVFAAAVNNASMAFWSAAFSGAATGKAYDVSVNASLASAGPARTDFPGDSAGTVAYGGQYRVG